MNPLYGPQLPLGNPRSSIFVIPQINDPPEMCQNGDMNSKGAIVLKKSVVFVGQAPPLLPSDEPFGRTRLYEWLSRIGISKTAALESFSFLALVNQFPGKGVHGHKPPSPSMIKEGRAQLLKRLRALSPDIVVPVGTLAMRECLGDQNAMLSDTIGHSFHLKPFQALNRKVLVIPLPHPSGASAWIHLPGNAIKLDAALNLLSSNLSCNL